MSYTTILGLTYGEGNKSWQSVEDIKELRNSWGSAAYVWDALMSHYFPSEPYCNDKVLVKLFEMIERMSGHQSAVLLMTSDHGYVTREFYDRASVDIRAFLTEFPPKPGNVNHWETIKTFFDDGPEYDAIAFHQTSVTENTFLTQAVCSHCGQTDPDGEMVLVALDVTYPVYDTKESADHGQR